MKATFKKDKQIAEIAEAYSLDALDIAKDNFDVTLDWSEESIEAVEAILNVLHEQMSEERPDDQTIETFAKSFGSYVGEVFRKRHGGDWGMVTLEEEEFPGIDHKKFGTFWPWGRVHKRLVDGPENNVYDYYRRLTASA